VLHSKEFRRLAGKTQVFVSGFDDHFRTRLTHTLEVSQIARTIGRALGLNELLTEAIALAHDVGHTPFGHVGERWLRFIMSGCYQLHGFEQALIDHPEKQGFRHNWQGVRAVRRLEEVSPDYKGLNLAHQTVWGILHHTKLKWTACPYQSGDRCSLPVGRGVCCHPKGEREVPFYRDELDVGVEGGLDSFWTFEGLVVGLADEIAQRHHDIEDGVRAGILARKEVLDKLQELFGPLIEGMGWAERVDGLASVPDEYLLPQVSRFVVDFLASHAIEQSKGNLEEEGDTFAGSSHLAKAGRRPELERARKLIAYSDEFEKAERELHRFLQERVLNSYLAQSMDGKAGYVIRQLFKAFVTNPEQLPDRTVMLLHGRYEEEDGYEPHGASPTVSVGNARAWLRKIHSSGDDSRFKALLLRTICDFVAGMTDSYAMHQHEVLYGSQKPWRAIVA